MTTTMFALPSAPRASARSELRVAAAVVAGGLVLGAVWALWAPSLARSADLGEGRVSVDGLLALLGLGAGLVTAVGLAVVPGPRPALRLGVVLGAATVGELLAVLVGAARGLSLGAPGVALSWPLTTAILTGLRTLASFIVSPDSDGAPRPARHGRGQDGVGRDDPFSGQPRP